MQKKYKLKRRYTSFGEHLTAARKNAGLTQRQVAIELGYSSAQFVSNFERGIFIPPPKRLKVLQRIYKMEINDLVEIIIESEKESLKEALLKNLTGNHRLSN